MNSVCRGFYQHVVLLPFLTLSISTACIFCFIRYNLSCICSRGSCSLFSSYLLFTKAESESAVWFIAHIAGHAGQEFSTGYSPTVCVHVCLCWRRGRKERARNTHLVYNSRKGEFLSFFTLSSLVMSIPWIEILHQNRIDSFSIQMKPTCVACTLGRKINTVETQIGYLLRLWCLSL